VVPGGLELEGESHAPLVAVLLASSKGARDDDADQPPVLIVEPEE
jgi:hypothetical protein